MNNYWLTVDELKIENAILKNENTILILRNSVLQQELYDLRRENSPRQILKCDSQLLFDFEKE